ncbi:cytochrome c class I precursor [Vibrio maritimus]|uniref:Cytochrome c class I n=1 Tax=Vibrio maritimus TaxID=990268 RepID=A0A090S1N8_9VIBR|nr:cytochrome c class I precursor [Vibrio maritimus]
MKILICLCLLISAFAHAEFNSVTLPSDTTKLLPSELPGYELARSKCHLCHSMDYVFYQPPRKDFEEWTKEMMKMRNAYGAPISAEEAKYIAAYLAVSYGTAKEDDPEIAALTKSYDRKEVYKYQNLDVQELMDTKVCIACNVDDQTLLDIKHEYEGQPNALIGLDTPLKQARLMVMRHP